MQRTRSASAGDGGDVLGLALGVERDADLQAVLARGGDRRGHVVDDLVVERDAVAAGARDLREVPQRVVDHQVAVEHAAGVVHERRDRLEHDGPDRDRLDEVPVADVEVEDAAAGAQEHVDLLAEAREVRRVERRLDLDRPDPARPRPRAQSTARSDACRRATKKPARAVDVREREQELGRRGCA